MTINTHCPHCRRLLSIPELVEQFCEACARPTNVKADAPKRAA
jgi:ribosomal protein L44E